MYNKQLDTFISVVENGSFAKAAQAGYISSSAVIQQINHLENNLQVQLMIRKKSGIELTEAGRYFYLRAKEIVQQDREIREKLHSLAAPAHTITIGSSLPHKVRLLYEIWMLYAQKYPDQTIRMVNVVPEQSISPEVELIETIQDASPWQQSWKFLKICDVHIACALSRSHPLSSRKTLSAADISAYTVLCLKREQSKEYTMLCSALEKEGIYLKQVPEIEASDVWDVSVRNQILLVPDCWRDILVDLEIIPLLQTVSLPYGLFYRSDPSKDIQNLLDFTHKLYYENDSSQIVPVF